MSIALDQADFRISEELREQLKFETLLADLSSRFVNLPADQVDGQIEEAQRRICECLDLEHSSLWQTSVDEPGILLLTHLRRHPGLTPTPDRMDADAYFPWAQRKLRRREIVNVPCTPDAPPDAAIDKRTWEALGIKSTLGLPLSVGDGPVFGVLSFEGTTRERDWPEPLVQRLQLLAQVFSNALARQRTERELLDSEARLRLAAASANAGLWTLEAGSGSMWATDPGKRLLGLQPADELDLTRFLSLVHPDDRQGVMTAIEEARGSGRETQIEYRIIRPDGKERWLSSLGGLRSGASGEPDRLMGVCVDITERKRAEEALQRSYAEIKRLKEQLQVETAYLQEELENTGRYGEIVGDSEALRQVLRSVEQVAGTDSVVLITGETGTGKELIARAIHRLSRRKNRVMAKIDCAALPPTLIESELFGREKGAYTGALSQQIGRFETADGSTLFLDEIGELGVDLQAKLLRIVQDGEFERLGSAKTVHVNVRLIAATHRDLAERVRSGSFREDLFYRLNVFPIRVPPLRERVEDIPLLAAVFIREFEKKMGKTIRRIPARMMDELKSYAWPGNVRELRNIVERAVIISAGETLNLQMPKAQDACLALTLRESERRHILATLQKTQWRVKGPGGAAAILGLHPATLYTTMRRLQIPTQHERKKDGIPS